MSAGQDAMLPIPAGSRYVAMGSSVDDAPGPRPDAAGMAAVAELVLAALARPNR